MTDDPSAELDAAPLVREVLPMLAAELHRELMALGEVDLDSQVDQLRVVRPCSCGDDFCQSFATRDHEPGTPYGPSHQTVPLLSDMAMVNLDVVEGQIIYVEIIL